MATLGGVSDRELMERARFLVQSPGFVPRSPDRSVVTAFVMLADIEVGSVNRARRGREGPVGYALDSALRRYQRAQACAGRGCGPGPRYIIRLPSRTTAGPSRHSVGALGSPSGLSSRGHQHGAERRMPGERAGVVVACVAGLQICYMAATRTRKVPVTGVAVASATDEFEIALNEIDTRARSRIERFPTRVRRES